MVNVIAELEPAEINMTGAAFMTYANRYREAAEVLLQKSGRLDGFDPVTYFLACLSLELHLKPSITKLTNSS
jgi:hypothetical protein